MLGCGKFQPVSSGSSCAGRRDFMPHGAGILEGCLASVLESQRPRLTYNDNLMSTPLQKSSPWRFHAVQTTPFGAVGVRVDAEAISELVFLPPDTQALPPENALARDACRQIAAYAADPDFRFDLPLRITGSIFQRQVWDAIAAIPRGRTRQYGEIASELGAQPRAVGQACGDNALPLVIPCHRVVSASGLGGFAHHGSGFYLRVKQWLLAHEFDARASGRLL
jgi:methylated-DNA-[protein]-cysteine S-methyltransferase